MSLRRISFLLASAIALATGSGALADTLQLNKTAHSNTGGVFAVTQSGDLDVSHYHSSALYLATTGSKTVGFGTFCLEYSEPFTPGQTFTYTIDAFANAGGLSGQTSPGQDPISMGTAWLYSLFATGELDTTATSFGASFDYTSTIALRTLQNAFWFLEGEGQGTLANTYVQMAVAKFGDITAATADAGGAYGVAVLNLKQGTALRQSQLYFQGLPTSVPEGGATLALLAIAMGCLAFVRRRIAR